MKKERFGYDPPTDFINQTGAQIEMDALKAMKMTAKGPAWLVAFLAIIFSATLIASLLVYFTDR